MAKWLYQMSQTSWTPNNYRSDVWENERWRWPIGQKRGSDFPNAGDVVVFFYAPTGGEEGGFAGWAVVLDSKTESREVYFRAVPPTDQLKLDPWWDDQSRALADQIRGRVKQGTLWPIPEDVFKLVAKGMRSWAAGGTATEAFQSGPG